MLNFTRFSRLVYKCLYTARVYLLCTVMTFWLVGITEMLSFKLSGQLLTDFNSSIFHSVLIIELGATLLGVVYAVEQANRVWALVRRIPKPALAIPVLYTVLLLAPVLIAASCLLVGSNG